MKTHWSQARRHLHSAFFSRSGDKWIFLAILALALLLRFTGLGWGLPTSAIPHMPFHPDEVWAMNVLREVSVVDWQFNPYSAHLEGTLSYYLILAAIGLLRMLSVVQTMPNGLAEFSPDYATTILAGRVVTSLFDVFSVVMVYLVLKNISKSRAAPFVGAFIFAIMPFEIIYSHYMRSHAIANFFVLLTIYLATFLHTSEDKNFYPYIGIACGLAAATKYPSAVVVSVPLLIILMKGVRRTSEAPLRAWQLLLEKRSRIIFGFLLLGFFAADPFLFLKFDSAKPHIVYLTTFMSEGEFTFLKLFDISRLWDHIMYLIPYGNLPYLWVLLYASTLYLLFRPTLYRVTIPLFVFFMLFFYPMAKGYMTPRFIRATLALFPIFAIFTGLAWGDWLLRLGSHRARGLAWCLFAVVCLPTIAYDWAYVSAMGHEDPRIAMHKYLDGRGSVARPIRLGLFRSDFDYFLTLPTLRLFIADKTLQIDYVTDPVQAAGFDYILLYAFEPRDYEIARSHVDLLGTWNFDHAKTFENPLTFFGYRFQYSKNPHDLMYPFPTLILMKSAARPS